MLLKPMGTPGKCPAHCRAWTPEEDEILFRWYGKKNNSEIALMLHGRSRSAVKGRLEYLRHLYPEKLKPLNYKFTPEDDLFIRRNRLTMTSVEMADHIGVSPSAIRQRARRKGISLAKYGDNNHKTVYPDSYVDLIRQLRDERNLKFREIGELLDLPERMCSWLYEHRLTADYAIAREYLPR
ncbi:AsnC family protein [Salmonella enterica subsp. enterica serovar Ealing]|nr:AsnC family protein [Salmonella enterica subsp. enterica serovar Adelaide]EDU1332070.1 AsnC family protein [Salmonella enterica subsp. enterica serovar Braenderup]EDX6361098.1 AsnC family protein [Salmonella enterica subsp. enterica serovar Ealing]EHW1577983.1 AsnC family protein [Salmonella enterica]EJE2190683.1 AsnC family protein [Salmonella enterica]